MTAAPKVTVFMPVYNRAAFVASAIDSILAQSFRDLELLVIDDGSTDDSAALVDEIADPRIRLERNGINLGLPATRNKGLELARGEYIALLDSDDYAYPQRLARQVAFLEGHRDHGVVGSWCGFMDASGKVLKEVKRHPVTNGMIQAEMLFACRLSNRSIMGRTAILREHGYDERFTVNEDYDLFSRIAIGQKLANLPELLVLGRRHEEQTTAHTASQDRQMRLTTLRRQLERLAIEFSVDDLKRHYYLTRRGHPPFTPDRSYLDWAGTWLHKLHAANGRRNVFPQPEFARALGLAWVAACWRARGASSLYGFSQPRLCGWAMAGVKQRIGSSA